MEQEKKKRNIGKNVAALLLTIIVAIGILIGREIYATTSSTEIVLEENDITIEVGTEYQEPGYKAYINGENVTNKVIITSNLDTNKVGDYKIVYHLIINFVKMERTATRIVHVVDMTKPELIVDGKKEIKIEVDSKFEEPKYIAKDNYDGDITEFVRVKSNVDTTKIGTYHIEYNVVDSSQNETTESIEVKVTPKKNAHIIVSISKQKLTYYEYGEAVLTSNVVTGINGKTPIGTFKVRDKERDVILKGADYESFVSYWIAFKGNSFGFHDASWRSSFGGTVYKNHGSHGCVNMPYSKVKQLYNMVSIGTPVYIQN